MDRWKFGPASWIQCFQNLSTSVCIALSLLQWQSEKSNIYSCHFGSVFSALYSGINRQFICQVGCHVDSCMELAVTQWQFFTKTLNCFFHDSRSSLCTTISVWKISWQNFFPDQSVPRLVALSSSLLLSKTAQKQVRPSVLVLHSQSQCRHLTRFSSGVH